MNDFSHWTWGRTESLVGAHVIEILIYILLNNCMIIISYKFISHIPIVSYSIMKCVVAYLKVSDCGHVCGLCEGPRVVRAHLGAPKRGAPT